tara:strand:- start:2259 stop:2630 length:372 start_codon:yes stop_codon:yes gene_type:complete
MKINSHHLFNQAEQIPTAKERSLRPSNKQIVKWRRIIKSIAEDPDFIYESENIKAANHVIELVCQQTCIEKAYHAHESLTEFAYTLVPVEVSDLIVRSYNAHYNNDFLMPTPRIADILEFPKK